MKSRTIICFGRLAEDSIGHMDHFMAYVSGFEKLGHRVYVVDEVSRKRCVDASGQRVALSDWPGTRRFEALMRAYDLWPRCALLQKRSSTSHGMAYDDLRKVVHEADLLLVRSGRVTHRQELFERIPCRIYLDGNPGVPQVLADQGNDYYRLANYTHLFTIGQALGTDACPFPMGERPWHRTLFPVDLEHWPIAGGSPRDRFTTISSWGSRVGFVYRGTAAGEKQENWQQFVDLPRRTDQALEVAMRFDEQDQVAGEELLHRHGWHLTDPRRLETWTDYRDYLAGSRGEFSIAHPRVVRFQVGWLSDRTSRYLACGRPALVQSTGLESHLPTGKGLLTFRTVEEAVAGLAEINRDYRMHCRAARALAEEYLDAEKILARMLREAGF